MRKLCRVQAQVAGNDAESQSGVMVFLLNDNFYANVNGRPNIEKDVSQAGEIKATGVCTVQWSVHLPSSLHRVLRLRR